VGHELYLVRQGHAPLATWPYSMSVKRCCIAYIGQVTRFYEKVAHYEGRLPLFTNCLQVAFSEV
jgi:hypothetical protein